MVHSDFVLRLLKVLLLGLGRAGAGCGRFWVWALVAVGMGISAIGTASGQGGMLRTANADRVTQNGATPFEARQALHREESWLAVAAHLPDPKTASADKLELAGDVLRARRYPEDALDYYAYAVQRGADEQRVLNKMGVTELGLRHTARARAYLKASLKKDRKNADAWNNLGATEYMDSNLSAAISAYRKALKLKPGVALFHANLGTAMVEKKDFEGARVELAKALELDPEFGSRKDSEAGIAAHVLSAADRAQYCFEMARAYASRGMTESMLNSLAMASECGMDLKARMEEDTKLRSYVADPRVVLLMQNAKAQKKPALTAQASGLTALPAAVN